ncbi:uncharacterized protein LOC128228095 isoform X2 [Mya arenaria]|uniref:uncharacterized protein LOC128228095 isoform X2 n=1 Tax=Mya arenaria TaxID=6604 RepID=UPI0022E801BC|nr:uncharacterized protein LOC128228095 isoform X2 [Mya arenaria]
MGNQLSRQQHGNYEIRHEDEEDINTVTSVRSSSLESGYHDSLTSTLTSENRDGEADIKYMVEAFQPILERTLIIGELLPYLSFLHASDSLNCLTQKESVQKLIKLIEHSNEKGKWTAFLNALHCADYQPMVNILQSFTEKDLLEDRAILRILKPAFIKEIHPVECVDCLVERNVLNESDMEAVQAEKDRRGDIAATCVLLDRLPNRNSDWLLHFINCLSHLGRDDLAAILVVPEVTVIQSEKNQHKADTTIRKEVFYKEEPYSTNRVSQQPSVEIENTERKEITIRAGDETHASPVFQGSRNATLRKRLQEERNDSVYDSIDNYHRSPSASRKTEEQDLDYWYWNKHRNTNVLERETIKINSHNYTATSNDIPDVLPSVSKVTTDRNDNDQRQSSNEHIQYSGGKATYKYNGRLYYERSEVRDANVVPTERKCNEALMEQTEDEDDGGYSTTDKLLAGTTNDDHLTLKESIIRELEQYIEQIVKERVREELEKQSFGVPSEVCVGGRIYSLQDSADNWTLQNTVYNASRHTYVSFSDISQNAEVLY